MEKQRRPRVASRRNTDKLTFDVNKLNIGQLRVPMNVSRFVTFVKSSVGELCVKRVKEESEKASVVGIVVGD